MEKLPGRNTVKTIIAPGVWIDADDNIHFNLPDLCQACGLEPTEENQAIAEQAAREILAERPHRGIIRRRRTED